MYYFIFYFILLIVLCFVWKFFLKPYKIKDYQKLALNFYIVGVYLEEINLGLTLDSRLKRNISFLEKELKKLRRKYDASLDIDYKESIETLLNNVDKLNDYKTKTVKNLLSNDRLSARFLEIGEALHDARDYNSIKDKVINLANMLKEIPKIKFTEKYLDVYSLLGVLAIIILLFLFMVFPEHQSIIAALIGVISTLISIRTFGKSNT